MNRALCATLLSIGVTGCGTVADVRNQIDQAGPKAQATFNDPPKRAQESRLLERSNSLIPVKKVPLAHSGGAWLRQTKTDFFNAPSPVPVSQFLAFIAAKGINIVTDLPLDNITYTGTVNATDVESALRIVLGSAHLDYEVDDARHIVTVKSLPSKVWTLNIGNRKSSASIGQVNNSAPIGQSGSQGNTTGGAYGNNNAGGVAQNGPQQNGQSSGNGLAGAQSSQGNNASQTTVGTNNGMVGTAGVSTDDNFWVDLDNELKRRLKVPLPVARPRSQQRGLGAQAFPTQIPGMQMPGIQQPAQAVDSDQNQQDQSGSTKLVQMTDIGTYSLNPGTGAVRVVAPHWVLAELDTYIRGIQEMYNAVITFEGQLVLVTQTKDKSEGIDMHGFGKWAAGRYGALLSNNALGGVTVNFPTGAVPSAVAGNPTLGGALFGIVDKKDGLQAFNNYMERFSNFSVKGGIKVSTSSGVPGSMSTLEPYPYQVLNQSAVVGNVGAAQQATNYTIQYENFGTTMRVVPRYDLATGKVRALIEVHNSINAGEKSFEQKFGIGDTTQSINQVLPVPKKMDIAVEVQMRDGDLKLLGGQSFETAQTTESGLPTGGAPLGGIFGSKNGNVVKSTYYFLLQMKIEK